MRAGVWWSAAALTLLALASAYRTPQVEGASRAGRRLSAPSSPEATLDGSDTEDVQPTFRQRGSRRREETPPREAVRSRTRSRPVEATAPESEKQPEGRNERFDSRRTYSRTRNRHADSEAPKDTTPRDNISRSRTRQSSRRTQPPSTQAPIELSSPTIDESKIEVVNSNLDELTKVTKQDIPATTFRRRSSIAPTTETVTRSSRGRANTRPISRTADLAVSGTTNTVYREPTTARISPDLRNSRKLRYKTRLSETDTNLTGEGMKANDVTKSSQNKEIITSQPEIHTAAPIVVAETTVQPSTEAPPVKTTTNKVSKVIRRPLVRGKVNFRPSVSLPKLTKTADDISEDDNYPESFKALIQAKNASTQASSPPSESLSVKASQKVYKTYSSSAQSTNTGPAKNKYSRFRSKLNGEKETENEDGNVEAKPIETTTSAPDNPKPKIPEYKPRGSYTPRNRKSTFSTSTSTSVSISSSESSERPSYKYNRKFKVTTSTESPRTESTIKGKRFETNNPLKKTLTRPSYYSRRNSQRNITSSEAPTVAETEKTLDNGTNIGPSKSTLPKTSYYSRLRNRNKSDVSSTVETITEPNILQTPAENKNEDPVDMPLIFSLLKSPSNGETNHENNGPEKEREMFIIAVSSKESDEKNTDNELVKKEQESVNKSNVNTDDTTSKYHATYKDRLSESESETKELVTPVPGIRNIQTRKYGRKRTKSKDLDEDVPTVTPKPRERHLRKFSDSYSKSTEPSTNGIPPEPDRHKSRFSSKYRASYLDKPFYKPTVPTITSSTVEGEEFQIGPDMNAISFTMPRSTLSSADLRLSESLAKPSQVLNVEASQHSASVTISIFDALADILTSTPRTPRISSTTEVMQKQNKNNVKQTLNGTQQIRTEKPIDGRGGVFKFIPIDEVTVAQQDSNVLKLASTKAPFTSNTADADVQTVTAATVTEINTQTPQIQTQRESTDNPTTTVQVTAGTTADTKSDLVFTNGPLATTESITSPPITTVPPTTTVITTTFAPTTTTTEPTTTSTTTTPAPTTTQIPTTTAQITTFTSFPTATNTEEDRRFQEDTKFLQSLFQGPERNPKNLNVFTNSNQIPGDVTTSASTTSRIVSSTKLSEEARLLQAILAANQKPNTLSVPNIDGNIRVTTGQQTTTSRSIEDDIKQFEEDTKLLKALLAATGQNPNALNIPSIDSINIPSRTTTPVTTTTFRQTTTAIPTTTTRVRTTTPTIEDDIQKFSEDAKLLQALLQATGQNTNNANFPIISGVTSNVRIASNPLTTSIGSNPTTPINIRPVYTSRTTTPTSSVFTSAPSTIGPILTTLQPRAPTTVTEDARISTTFSPKARRRMPTTTARTVQATPTGRRAPSSRFAVTTEVPSTSTFSDQEDLLFLQNLKSVLDTNNSEDPEADLANRIIALAVEKSLNEIQSGKQADDGRTGKNLATTVPYRIPTTTTTTTPRPTTTTSRPTTTIKDNTPSIEDDIKQFQEDTKLLQALLKATGQDPSKFNIPTLPIANTNVKVSSAQAGVNDDLNLLSNLLASPSPLNEPFDSLTQKPSKPTVARTTIPTTPKAFGAKIAVRDDLKNVQDDAKLLQTLVKLQGAQETTTQRSKLAITGQSPDEALQKLIQQTKPSGMVSEATKAPMSISTEYGKSNDALLAALLKEQGFGPTTASSLDEQLRLAALLNQVVVTPKSRRTTTPPPPPAPRRPILDGLAWLWQQWRDTAPGPEAPRPSRRPAASPSPSVASSSAATSNRVNWFGSGPFVGNADDRPTSNRIPLEPPRAVTAEQTPGRGQLVSAAINVTRAFSQFLGAAIQGAAQTVQNVIRAGQRAATDVYTNGSG